MSEYVAIILLSPSRDASWRNLDVGIPNFWVVATEVKVFTESITSVCLIPNWITLGQSSCVHRKKCYVHFTLRYFFSDSLIAPTRTVYVVSDSQLEELMRNQRQEEFDDIEDTRKRLEESYKARIKAL